MAEPVSISLRKFTSSVQAAVKAAMAKHPKFKLKCRGDIGFVLDSGNSSAGGHRVEGTLGETQAFATDVASHLGQAHPEAFGVAHPAGQEGAVLSVGQHVIIGIPTRADIIKVEP